MVATGAATGDDEAVHACTSRIAPEPRGSVARPQLRWELRMMPSSIPISIRLERPALMKGSDMPLVGNTPVTTPMLMIAWTQISRMQPRARRKWCYALPSPSRRAAMARRC